MAVAMVMASILESLNVIAIYPVINYGLNMQGQNHVLEWMDWLIQLFPFQNPFYSACVFLIGLTILAALTKIMYHYLSNRLTMDIVANTQKNIFRKLM